MISIIKPALQVVSEVIITEIFIEFSTELRIKIQFKLLLKGEIGTVKVNEKFYLFFKFSIILLIFCLD